MAKSVVTMRNIGPGRSGKGSRFGNHLFKYAFTYKLKIETSPWIGQFIFGRKDAPISHRFQTVIIDETVSKDILKPKKELLKHRTPPFINVDLTGNHHFAHTSFYRPYRKHIRKPYSPQKEIYRVVWGLIKLRKIGKTVFGIHIRRGDFLRFKNHSFIWTAPISWYLKWLQ
ncbi:O-fucosyltransferase family protein [Paenibacillus aestuarii]|uniref:Uncharacterized protein n=1 Tax=Paenibacillus aestuarii TaxID=516965 RepID=A0ABW0K2U3_9BACL|nr:hypothetical protein [Paenibacillus aestuarii]